MISTYLEKSYKYWTETSKVDERLIEDRASRGMRKEAMGMMAEMRWDSAASRTIALALICTLAAMPLSACSMGSSDANREQPRGTASAQENVQADSDATEEDAKGRTVSTPVGSIDCPASWGDDVQIIDDTTNGSGSIRFVTSVGGSQVELFSLDFGSADGEYVLGTAPDASGAPVAIALSIAQIDRRSNWSDEDAKKVSGLQDGVNELLDQIYQLSGFEAVNS